MSTISVAPDALQIRFTLLEKIGGLVRDIEVPLASILAVEVVEDGLAAAKGIRAPGLGIPGVRKLGTWRGRGSKTLVSVRRGQPALLLEVSGARFDTLLIGSDRAEEYAAATAGF